MPMSPSKGRGAFQLRQARRVPAEIRRLSLYRHHTTSLVFNDAPLHSRVRRLIAGADAAPSRSWSGGRCAGRLPARRHRAQGVDIVADGRAIPSEVISNPFGVLRPAR
jgi:hypothetical protein